MKNSTIAIVSAVAALGVAAVGRVGMGPREKHRAGPLDELESQRIEERREARKRQRAARKHNRRKR